MVRPRATGTESVSARAIQAHRSVRCRGIEPRHRTTAVEEEFDLDIRRFFQEELDLGRCQHLEWHRCGTLRVQTPVLDAEIDREIRASFVVTDVALENCRIENIGSRMSDSLIGRNVIVRRGVRPPRAYRLMVGDNSEITVL